MQKILLTLIGILILGGIGGLVWYEVAFQAPSQQGNTHTNPPYSYPDNTTGITPSGSNTVASSSATITIPIPGDKTMTVRDFIHNGETVADVVNPGYYILAGSLGYCLGDGSCPSGYKTDDFVVSYHDTTGVFTVTLLKEPLSQSRDEAGVFLITRLGLTAAQTCTLNYWVGVPDTVNAIYSGKNLGFAFCPGATQL